MMDAIDALIVLVLVVIVGGGPLLGVGLLLWGGKMVARGVRGLTDEDEE